MPRKPSKNRIFAEDILCGLYMLREDELLALGLTRREVTVAQHMLCGESNMRIAKALYLSKSGVKFHVGNIFSKAGVHSREKLSMMIQAAIANSERNWANKAELRADSEMRARLRNAKTPYSVVAISNR